MVLQCDCNDILAMSITGRASVNMTVMERCVYEPFYLMLIAADAFLYITFHFLLLLWQLDGVQWVVKPLQTD